MSGMIASVSDGVRGGRRSRSLIRVRPVFGVGSVIARIASAGEPLAA